MGGGGNTECALRKGFWHDSIFSLNYQYCRSLSLFWDNLCPSKSVSDKQAPQIENTNVFCKTKMCFAKHIHICVLNQNTFVICHTPENCCHGTYFYANISKYYERYLHPHRPPPSATAGAMMAPSLLPWLTRFLCWFAIHLQEDTGLGGK